MAAATEIESSRFFVLGFFLKKKGVGGVLGELSSVVFFYGVGKASPISRSCFLHRPPTLCIRTRVQVAGVVCEKNALVERDGRVVAVGTGVTETIPAGAVFKSIGYTAVPVEGVRGRLVILVCCFSCLGTGDFGVCGWRDCRVVRERGGSQSPTGE